MTAEVTIVWCACLKYIYSLLIYIIKKKKHVPEISVELSELKNVKGSFVDQMAKDYHNIIYNIIILINHIN